jgi:sec-independent protein translocase protein TatB
VFEIGFWEIVLILILALLVIGPERLPGAARTAGFWFGKARRYIEGVRDEVSQQFDVTELKRLIHNQEVQINELQQKLHTPLVLDDDKEIADATGAAYEIIEQDNAAAKPDGEGSATPSDDATTQSDRVKP